MQYLLLAYADEQQWEAAPENERPLLSGEAFERACRASDEALRAHGYLLAAAHLQSSRAAATVRLQNGLPAINGAPPAGGTEQLASIFLIQARDLNEAVRVAGQMPQARRGPIEVRPVARLDWPPETAGQDSG